MIKRHPPIRRDSNSPVLHRANRAHRGEKEPLSFVPYHANACWLSFIVGAYWIRNDSIIFAISQGEVSFGAFAHLFRDGMNCSDALFLDGGSAASLDSPSLNRHGDFVSLGPMLAVFEKNRGASRQ